MSHIIKINCAVLVVIFTILVKAQLCIAECNLAKIFRTPRDFDQLEIVERAGFDLTESTTLAPTCKSASKSTRKNGNNHASAHVSLRFGTDYGSHIMKVPPQRRHLVGHGINNFPDTLSNSNFIYPPPLPYRIPPPCPSHQYYHPYPPPVPYIFPNYYFSSPGEESKYLPPQLNEYFRRHPDFVVARYPYQEEIFAGGRPVRRELEKVLVPADFVRAEVTPLKIMNDHLDILKPIQILSSRILKPVDPTQETVEVSKHENIEIKRDCSSQPNDNCDDTGNNISMEFSDSHEETPYEIYDQNQTNTSAKLNDPTSNVQVVQTPIDNTSKLKFPESVIEDVDRQMDDLIDELKASARGLGGVPNQTDDLSDSKSQEPSSEECNDDHQNSLKDSLVEYKHENGTSPPKMLITYPIFNRDDKRQNNSSYEYDISKQDQFTKDIDNLKLIKTQDIVDDGTYTTYQGSNSTTSLRTGNKFINDMDDLVSVTIEIIDTGNCPLSTSRMIPTTAKPYFSDDPLLYPDVISPFSPFLPKAAPPPLSSILNLLLGYYNSLNSQVSYSLNQYKDNSPDTQLGHLCPSESAPKSIVVYNDSPQVKLSNVEPPETYLSTQQVSISTESSLPAYLKVVPIIKEAKTATLSDIPNLENRFHEEYFQEPNVLIREESILPEYFQILPRSDLEYELPMEEGRVPALTPYSNIPDKGLESTAVAETDFCRKCGNKHSGGNYCEKCGYPLIFYPGTMEQYCSSCTKETRQLND